MSATVTRPPIVTAEAWAIIPISAPARQKIALIAELLEEVLSGITGSNLPADQQALSEIEKAQLIAILQTALKLLQSPMVERGLIRRLTQMLKDAAIKAGEKQVQQGVAQGMEEASKQLMEFMKNFFHWSW